jgi:hypothetical protein
MEESHSRMEKIAEWRVLWNIYSLINIISETELRRKHFILHDVVQNHEEKGHLEGLDLDGYDIKNGLRGTGLENKNWFNLWHISKTQCDFSYCVMTLHTHA